MISIARDDRPSAETNASLLKRDENVFLRQSGSTPCIAAIEKAEGIWLQDAAGNRFIDMHGNNSHHVGYGHPRLVEAVVRQMRSLPFTPRRFTDRPAIELAERLCAMWPGGAAKVLFATGGSDAIEIAMKLARVSTGRYKTISFYGSYHGSGFGALSLGGRRSDRPQRLGPLLTGALHVPPYYRAPAEAGQDACDAEKWAVYSVDCMRSIFEHDGDIAAVVAEPIRSTPYVPPPWFWEEVRTLCDQYGSLLIFDEIPTGIGKTGRMFASEHFGVKPDITVLGKALGGGALPIAAVIASISLDCAADLSLGHYTHEKNPVTASAALATLDIIADEGLVENARRVGEHGLSRLQAMAEGSPLICGVRGKGLLFAIDLRAGPAVGETGGSVAARVAQKLLEGGLSISASQDGVLSMSAPLIINADELHKSFDLIEEVLACEAEPKRS